MKQREIKFRWIAPETGKWEYIKIEDITAEIDFGETLGQFTGLKDKNGKEIYEGDILDGDYPDEVFWDNDRGQWMLRNFENPNDTLWEILRDNKSKIIGNIFENPELLNRGGEYK